MAKLGEMAVLYNNYCSGRQPVAKMLTIYIEECEFYCHYTMYFNQFV